MSSSDSTSSSVTGPRQWRKNPGSVFILPLGEKLSWAGSIFAVSLAYAIVRYNVFGGVEWYHLPLYVMNKAFALAGVTLIACSYLIGKWIPVYKAEGKRRRALTKFCGLTGAALIGMHVCAALAMLSPEYYAKFFVETGKMNLTGEVTFLFGVLGVLFLAFPALTTLPYMYEALGSLRWHKAQRMGYFCLLMAAGHTLTMGWKGWLDPGTWHGGLPPITMLGFAAAAAALVAKLTSSKR